MSSIQISRKSSAPAVKLDAEVKPTIAGIRAGRDEVLEHALSLAEDEIERLKEVARLEALAEQARLDSIRRDSLQRLQLTMDSVQLDSTQVTPLLLDSLDRGN